MGRAARFARASVGVMLAITAEVYGRGRAHGAPRSSPCGELQMGDSERDAQKYARALRIPRGGHADGPLLSASAKKKPPEGGFFSASGGEGGISISG